VPSNVPFSDPRAYVDRSTYITPDGVEYMLSSPLFVLQEDGWGMPPVEYVTERGPFQHGETVKDFFLRPRTLQLIVRRSGCSRSEYWDIRAKLLDILRPGRGLASTPPSPGILRKYLANGAVRELFVYTSEGPGFPGRTDDSWDQWSIQDVIRFTAYDPIARDPKPVSVTFQTTGVTGTFPLTFAWTSSPGSGGSQTINYVGTFLALPTIFITGPIISPLITNITTGEKIQLTFSLNAAEYATIDLSYGNKTVVKNDGTNLIGYVSSDSDLATFHLTTGGNVLQVTAGGTSIASNILLTWYNRYIGA